MAMIHSILLILLFSSIFVELFFSTLKERVFLSCLLVSFFIFGFQEYNNIFGIIVSSFMIAFEAFRMMKEEKLNYHVLIYPILIGLLCLWDLGFIKTWQPHLLLIWACLIFRMLIMRNFSKRMLLKKWKMVCFASAQKTQDFWKDWNENPIENDKIYNININIFQHVLCWLSAIWL